MKEYKPISNWIFIAPIIFLLLIVFFKNNTERILAETDKSINKVNIQKNSPYPQEINQVATRTPTPEEERAYMQEHNLIKLGNKYHWCEIKTDKEIKPITKALDMDCQNDPCKIRKYFDYVKKIPYEKGKQNQEKNAVDVVEEWKGDCDERSYLLASMMIANGYQTIILYTKDHAFTGVNIPNFDTDERRSYFTYKDKKYYYAETTNPNGYIGAYNGIDPKEIIHAYNINDKREIPLNQIYVQIFL